MLTRAMRVIVVQSPSPPGLNVKRDLAGGLGVADPSQRDEFGHDPNYITMPYQSLLYTASVLERDGHEVAFVDGQAENLDKQTLIARVREHQPDVVFQLLNLPSLYSDLELLKAIRERLGARTVAVGTITIPMTDFIADSGAANVIVRGDPEIAASSVMKLFAASDARSDNSQSPQQIPEAGAGEVKFENRNGVFVNPQVVHVDDLEKLPPMPYHLVPLHKYWYFPFGVGVPYATMFASRGCSFGCYYCPYPMGFGKRIVHRDPIRVVDEIEKLQRERGIKAILFRDQVFTMDREKTMRLCDEILRRRLKVSWLVETRLDKVDEELLRKMRQAGCVRMQFGIESGDEGLFNKGGKAGAKGLLELFIANFALVERVGLAAHMFVLVGLLGETWETVKNTIQTVRRMKPLTLQVAVVTPYPGTALFNKAKRQGLLTTEDLSQYTGFKPVSRTEKMSGEELEEARQMIVSAHERAVYWKRKKRLLDLTIRYTRDGTLPSRLKRRYFSRSVASSALA